MKKIFPKNVILLLMSFVALGLLLRNLYISKLAITFGYDQARDIFIVQEIINGDLKIQGPSANAPGMYHGVLYYYFLVIPYLISNGNPVVADIWLSVFNTLTIIVVYYFCFVLTKNRVASLFSALLFTVSFEMVQYASWLSNPSMAVWFVPLTYLCLWLWTQNGKKLHALLTGLFLGFSIQSDLFLVYHFVPVLIWIIINRKLISLKNFLFALIGGIIGTSTLILSEIKFNFPIFRGLTYLFGGGDEIVKSTGPIDFLLIYLKQLADLFILNLTPKFILIGQILGLFIVIWLIYRIFSQTKSNKPKYEVLLLLYLFSHISIIWFGGLQSPYIGVGIGVAVCILGGLFIWNIYKYSKVIGFILFLIIIWLNISATVSENKRGQTIFSTRPQMLLSNLVDVVDYTYSSSNGNSFSIDTVTAPLWLNTTWSAVYNWHGVKKYGYLPAWHGKDQVGYWGDNLNKDSKDILNNYLIIEPRAGIPEIYIKYAIDDENYKSKLIEEKVFDGITVQKRQKIR